MALFIDGSIQILSSSELIHSFTLLDFFIFFRSFLHNQIAYQSHVLFRLFSEGLFPFDFLGLKLGLKTLDAINLDVMTVTSNFSR